mmetsp:Transcript_65731/g.165654  ORF Transcript_65731/g.165654 Transcript_65731/m.165654 type:complete len:211 (-) Transcript_65731:280-912(-)
MGSTGWLQARPRCVPASHHCAHAPSAGAQLPSASQTGATRARLAASRPPCCKLRRNAWPSISSPASEERPSTNSGRLTLCNGDWPAPVPPNSRKCPSESSSSLKPIPPLRRGGGGGGGGLDDRSGGGGGGGGNTGSGRSSWNPPPAAPPLALPLKMPLLPIELPRPPVRLTRPPHRPLLLEPPFCKEDAVFASSVVAALDVTLAMATASP